MKQIKILLVEDNEGDVVLTLETFKELKLNNEVIVAKEGEEALKILKNAKEDNSQLPGLIFLDINLPKIDGKEILAVLSNDKVFNQIPVVILTTSSSQKDMEECNKEQVLAYITKPLDIYKFVDILVSAKKLSINCIQS